MKTFEGLKKFLIENRAYILTTLAFYLVTGHLILEMPVDWLIPSSTAITFTTSLTYAGLNYINREGLKYWTLSFILNLAVVTIFLGIFVFSYNEPPHNVRHHVSQACKTAVETKCQFVEERNITVPDTCIRDNSVIRDAIPYDLNEASNLNDTKVVCP